MRTYVTVFLTVFLAELGDKTQLATLVYAAQPGVNRSAIFAAAATALVASSLLAVLVGGRLAAWLPPQALRVAAGVAFVVIGGWLLLRAS